MSAPLGPCPACGGNEDGQGWCIGRRLFIQCAACDFSCVDAHWNYMHMKTTSGNAAAMRATVWAAREDMERAILHGHSAKYDAATARYTAAWDTITAALTGEKP